MRKILLQAAVLGLASVGGYSADTANAGIAHVATVTGTTTIPASGVSAWIQQAQPLVYLGDHSLAAVTVASSDSANAVRVGWNVDSTLYGGDPNPHLFVTATINGRSDHYNLAGHFVLGTSGITPGGTITPGNVAEFKILHSQGAWHCYYLGTEFGSYPDSTWSGAFTNASVETVGGEVLSTLGLNATQMGNGIPGFDGAQSRTDAASITNYALYGGNRQPLTMSLSDPNYYDSGNETANSFFFGGPGKPSRP